MENRTLKGKKIHTMPHLYQNLIICSILLIPQYFLAQAGTKDMQFGENGQITNLPYPTEVIPIDVSVANNLVYAFNSTTNVQDLSQANSSVTCFEMDGSLHTGFGNNGTQYIDQINLQSVVVDAANSTAYFIGGPIFNSSLPVIGTMDLTTGSYETQELELVLDPQYQYTLTYLVRDDNGRFLYTGFQFDTVTYESRVIASRLNSDLSLDETFGVNGYWLSAWLGEAWSLGKIRICVDHNHALFINYEVNYVTTITKLLESGVEDTSFTLAPEATETGSLGLNADMQIGADNSIYIVNNAWGTQHVVKLNNDGSLHTSFADNGVLAIPQPFTEFVLSLQRVQIQESGDLIVIGYITDMMTSYGQGKYLLRISEDGVIDPDYGQSVEEMSYNGVNTYNFGNCWTTIQPDGKLLSYDFIVHWIDPQTIDYDVMLSRYLSDQESGIADAPIPQVVFTYPNPASEQINVLLPSNAQNITSCRIFDATGTLVYQGNSIQRGLNIANLAAGIYTMCIVTENQSLVTTFLKN